MTEGDGPEGFHDGLPASFLQAEGDREQPAHGGVQAMVGSEQDQGEPGPVLVDHGAHVAHDE